MAKLPLHRLTKSTTVAKTCKTLDSRLFSADIRVQVSSLATCWRYDDGVHVVVGGGCAKVNESLTNSATAT